MNSIEEIIIKNILEIFRDKQILSDTGLEQLDRSFKSGKMTQETWISIFDTERTIMEGGNNED